MHYKCLRMLSVFVALSSLWALGPAWAQGEPLSARIEDCFAQCQSPSPLDERCIEEDIAQRQDKIEQECLNLPEGSQARQDCFTEVFRHAPDCGGDDLLSCLQACLQ